MDTVSGLIPAKYNPRKITNKQLDMLGKSMREFGDLSGIIKNVKTGNLIGGHQRVKHFDASWLITKHPASDEQGTVASGEIKTPFGAWAYREVDWPEKKEIAANIAANKHGGYFDLPQLKDLLLEIDDGSLDMDLTGFDEQELINLLIAEEEVQIANKTAEEAIEALSTKIRKIAKDNPRQMNSALAVIVNNGRGNAVLFLTDPNTADIVKELHRYADSGEHSPLETLVKSLL
jgi:hypothetical protein